MPKTYRLEVVLPFVTGLPADVSINTFHLIIADGADPADVLLGINEITAAYRGATTGPNGDSWGDMLSPIIDRTTDACYWRLYDLADLKPRPVVTDGVFTCSPSSDPTGLPMEVAVCVSYSAAGIPGVPRGRLRGRIFLGPLNADCLAEIAVDVEGLKTTSRQDFAGVAGAVLTNVSTLSSGAVTWGVYSRVDDEIRPIVVGFVDNEFDTQRRRGVDATARTIWS